MRLINSLDSTLAVPTSTGWRDRGIFNLIYDRVVFLATSLVNTIVRILSRNRPICRNDNDLEFVNVVEFIDFGLRGSSHTGELFVKSEVILNG